MNNRPQMGNAYPPNSGNSMPQPPPPAPGYGMPQPPPPAPGYGMPQPPPPAPGYYMPPPPSQGNFVPQYYPPTPGYYAPQPPQQVPSYLKPFKYPISQAGMSNFHNIFAKFDYNRQDLINYSDVVNVMNQVFASDYKSGPNPIEIEAALIKLSLKKSKLTRSDFFTLLDHLAEAN